MIRGHFLSEQDRNRLIALARDGSVAREDNFLGPLPESVPV
jgi:hypothetical protein